MNQILTPVSKNELVDEETHIALRHRDDTVPVPSEPLLHQEASANDETNAGIGDPHHQLSNSPTRLPAMGAFLFWYPDRETVAEFKGSHEP